MYITFVHYIQVSTDKSFAESQKLQKKRIKTRIKKTIRPEILQNRELWVIYRGPDHLAVVWFGSPPTPLLPTLLSETCLSFSVFLCIAGRHFWRESEGGWAKSQIIRRRESLALYKSFNVLRCEKLDRTDDIRIHLWRDRRTKKLQRVTYTHKNEKTSRIISKQVTNRIVERDSSYNNSAGRKKIKSKEKECKKYAEKKRKNTK